MDGGGVITVDSDAIDGRRRGRRGRRWALASPMGAAGAAMGVGVADRWGVLFMC
jgi:hypothetical protein